MRVVFAGTPPFAARALEALIDAGHTVSLVLTQPDRPAGRGLKLTPSAVAQVAAARALPVAKPPTLRDPARHEAIITARPDVMVVAAYGLILPPSVLAIPPLGCINIHASLLPRWRGAAPVQRAILAGDTLTGISIMRMDAGLDTGPVLLESPHPIGDRDTAGSLTLALAERGADAIVEALRDLPRLAPRPQADADATYAAKVSKSEARIEWSASNVEIDRKVRAFDPWPGAEARLGEDIVKIWSARPVEGQGRPGDVLRADASGLVVACGQGALSLESLQRPGGRRLPTAEFLRGHERMAGMSLG
ncbi:MAG TPA: methionyl-tRNA formyltransferase [Usitatibacter sp.]|nr:methionyl-tRNA formyltransferase [Usitatibacter sp.]